MDFFLITPQEAEQLRLALEDLPPPTGMPDVTRRPPGEERQPLPRGPRVVVHHPPVKETPEGFIIETYATTHFHISFDQNQAPVDMNSLEVRAKKGIFSLSLTDRLKPYVQGTILRADTVKLPSGRFLVQVEIADVAGGRTVETYRLDVRGA